MRRPGRRAETDEIFTLIFADIKIDDDCSTATKVIEVYSYLNELRSSNVNWVLALLDALALGNPPVPGVGGAPEIPPARLLELLLPPKAEGGRTPISATSWSINILSEITRVIQSNTLNYKKELLFDYLFRKYSADQPVSDWLQLTILHDGPSNWLQEDLYGILYPNYSSWRNIL